MKILIVPDIHGRTFWHEAKNRIGEVDKVVFLGDYVDPYGFEGISKQHAIDNLKDIIEFAKDNADKVVLLLGNHCLHYIYDIFKKHASGGRIDTAHYFQIRQMYLDNINLFKLAHETQDNNTKYLFSHAGVCLDWYANYQHYIGNLNAENLNKLLDTDYGISSLCDIGHSRWGNALVGSIVWADVDDHSIGETIGYYQIFGHTQQESTEIITDNYACLDVRKCFLLNNGKIQALE